MSQPNPPFFDAAGLLTITSTSTPPATTLTTLPTLLPRQQSAVAIPAGPVTVIIGGNNAARTSISSLQVALASAQASASLLASQSAQIALASSTAAASAQVLAAALANAQTQSLAASLASVSAVASAASVSSSAQLALASAASQVASANAIAFAARSSADARASGLAQAESGIAVDRSPSGVSSLQLSIAIVVSIVGTFILSALAFFFYSRYRTRRVKRIRKLRALIQSPDTASSTGTGAMVWEESFDGPTRRYTEKKSQMRMRAAPGDSPTLPPPVGRYAGISEKTRGNETRQDRAAPPPTKSSSQSSSTLMRPAPLQIVKERNSGMIPVTIVQESPSREPPKKEPPKEPPPQKKTTGAEESQQKVVRSFSKPLSSDPPKLYIFPKVQETPQIPVKSPRRSQFPREVRDINLNF